MTKNIKMLITRVVVTQDVFMPLSSYSSNVAMCGAAVSKTTVIQQHRPVHLNNGNLFIESLLE
jgi:hypothetical protein